MTPRQLPYLLLCALTVTASCGAKEYVLLSLESSRQDVATLSIATSDPVTESVLDDATIDVAKHGGFPLEVLFEPTAHTPRSLRATISIDQDTVIADYSWVPDKTTRVHVDLDSTD